MEGKYLFSFMYKIIFWSFSGGTRSLFDRLRALEEKMLELESTSPEYFAVRGQVPATLLILVVRVYENLRIVNNFTSMYVLIKIKYMMLQGDPAQKPRSSPPQRRRVSTSRKHIMKNMKGSFAKRDMRHRPH